MSLRQSVRLSVHKHKLGSQEINFFKTLYLSIFWKSGKKTQVLLKYDKNKEYLK